MKNNIIEIRKSRRSGADGTQEYFTPDDLANEMFNKLSDDMFTDFSKTYCDTCAGNGNLVIIFLERRLANCHTERDIFDAFTTVYAVELMTDNVDEMKERMLKLIWPAFERVKKESNEVIKLLEYGQLRSAIEGIINHNIVCSDFFKWDFENWCPVKEVKSKELF